MSDQFVGEIRIFAFNFAPRGWALCQGQLLPISQNTPLFSLLGTTYGGDGKSTFALPDLQGNMPMHPGQGSGLSLHNLGEMSGSETVTLLTTEIPSHTHSLHPAKTADASVNMATPSSAVSIGVAPTRSFTSQAANLVQMAPTQLGMAGGSLPHNNMPPYLAVNFCIALQGIFPPRH
ncbi:MAG: tail fiber protein [Burkholderiaceae bacterium]|jgi:microcystin-dependent protein|nr:tail fiber protein [Burkholderiaceae bacterium]